MARDDGGPGTGPEEALPEVNLGREPGLGVLAMLLKAFCAVILAGLALLTCTDVIGRYFFGHPVAGASELTQFGMGLLIFGALPLVTARREHVSIDLLHLLAGNRVAGLQRLVMALTSLAGLVLMSWQLWIRAGRFAQWGDGSIYLGVPLAPFAYFMSVMSALAALAIVLQGLSALVGRHGHD